MTDPREIAEDCIKQIDGYAPYGEAAGYDQAIEIIQAALSKACAPDRALLRECLDAPRAALVWGVVGDYDGAYDTERVGDRERDDMALGEHGNSMDGGYRVVVVLDKSLIAKIEARLGVEG